jgi:hypothetical protein
MISLAEMSARRKVALALLATAVATASVFAVATSGNYTQVVRARILTAVSLDVDIDKGVVDGSLESLTLKVRLLVENPSAKAMRVGTVGYKGWVRDEPAEVGWVGARLASDGVAYTENGTRLLYYPVFLASTVSDSIVEGGESLRIEVVNRTFEKVDNPDTFSDIEAIMNGTVGEPDWHHYAHVVMFVEEVHRNYGGGDTWYLEEMASTHRYLGELLDSGPAGLVGA